VRFDDLRGCVNVGGGPSVARPGKVRHHQHEGRERVIVSGAEESGRALPPEFPLLGQQRDRKQKKTYTEVHVTLGEAELTTKSSVELAIFVWQYLLIIGKLATRHSRTSQLNLGISQHQQLAHLALSSLGVFFLYFLWYLS
jgi:hypothetical protein